jgi:hypothetical protein
MVGDLRVVRDRDDLESYGGEIARDVERGLLGSAIQVMLAGER